MTNRRRLLLSYLANSFKYLPYSYEYLYYGLVPTTIDSKQVSNKAKVSKLYGNSVVENQLQKTTSTTYFNGNSGAQNFSTLADVNGVLTQTYHSTPSLNYQSGIISTSSNNRFDSYIGHKYLIRFKFRANINTNVRAYIEQAGYTKYFSIKANTWYECADILSATGNKTANYVMIVVEDATTLVAGNVLEFAEVQCIDITKRHPFNTPTTLTDNRIQAILNRDYITFNLGELKSVDIGEISSEPYNLFDEELEGGGFNFSTGIKEPSGNNFRIKNFISVVGGATYTMEYNRDLIAGTQYLMEYDENKNYIGYQGGFSLATKEITVGQNTRYITLQYYKASSGWATNTPTQQEALVCFHRTGTRTGYAPYQAPQTISFKYQGSGVGTAHDTYELTKIAHVFTKNMSRVDLGTLTWTQSSSYVNRWGAYNVINAASVSASSIGNCLCSKYVVDKFNNVYVATNDKTIAISESGTNINFVDSSFASYTAEQVKTALAGTELCYQLATPQVISIPRKHLAVVDLGSLNWLYRSDYDKFYISQSNLRIPENTTNIYCSIYLTGEPTLASTTQPNLTIATRTNQDSYLYIKDTALNGDTTALRNKLNNIYLFYECIDETTDIEDTIKIESGGTINTDSNVLPNADFLMKCK